MIPLPHMAAFGRKVVESLREHGVQRVELAGSVRRRVRHVKDLEVVVLPEWGGDLFGGRTGHNLDSWVDARLEEGWTRVKGGGPEARYYQLRSPGSRAPFVNARGESVRYADGLTLDLFVADPETWGLVLMIRTGSAAFSHAMARRGNELGLHFHHAQICRGYRASGFRDERGCDGFDPIPTPEEEDVFDALRVEWVEPRNRTSGRAEMLPVLEEVEA